MKLDPAALRRLSVAFEAEFHKTRPVREFDTEKDAICGYCHGRGYLLTYTEGTRCGCGDCFSMGIFRNAVDSEKFTKGCDGGEHCECGGYRAR